MTTPRSSSLATLAVLAGGQGSRMGRPKSELTVEGVPILQYLLARFRWPGPTLLITSPGRENPAGSGGFDTEVVDAVPLGGPLQGILTALENMAGEMLLVVPVDMPRLSREQLHWVLDELAARPNHLGLLLHRLRDGKAQIEPFPSAFGKAAAPIIRARLSDQRRSIHSLTDDPHFATIPAPFDWEESAWLNLNTPQDWDKFRSSDGAQR